MIEDPCARPQKTAERELQIHREFAANLIALNNEEDLLWYVAESVVGRLGYLDCVIYRLDPANNMLTQAAAIGEKTPFRRQIRNALRIPFGNGITGAVAAAREPLLINNTRSDPRYIHDLTPPGSELCVPICHGDDVLGVLDSEHPETHWFTPEDIGTFQAIASLTAAQWSQCRLITSLRSTSERLRIAERQAEAANKAKQDFLANISHEVRTPLNGISGCLEILESTPLRRDQLDMIERAQRSSADLTALIDQLLDFARIEAGTMELKEGIVNLQTLTEDVSAAFKQQATEGGLDFQLEADIAPNAVYTDAQRIRQILFNLVQNAIKFTDRGFVKVGIKRLHGQNLFLTVQDTGIGMSPETQERVFGRFVQADGSRSRRHGGIGLGLAITRDLVDLMGGKIAVESSENQGTQFSVRIPIREASIPDNQDAAQSPELPDFTAIRILLAEDSDTNAFVVTHHLSRCGANVTRARDGLEVLAALDKHEFDAVLMDVSMPKMDGLEATRQMRLAPLLHSLPVIALTAHVAASDIDACRKAGMDDFLTKPIDRSALYQTLTSHIRAQQDKLGDLTP